MLQKKESPTKIPVTPTKTNVTKEGIPTTTKIPVTPTKTNVTKEGIPVQHRQNLMLQNKSYQQQQ